MRVVVALVVLAGCGRFNFDPAEITTDAASVGCWPQWRDHTVSFAAPRQLTELPSPDPQHNAILAADSMTLFFSRGPSGNRDIYTATRPTRTSPFGAPAVRADASSASDEAKVTMTADELTLVISSNRAGAQAFDLWQLTRTTTADAFGGETLAPFGAINTTANESDPHLSDDGLTIYFAASGSPGQEIRAATRTSRTAVFDPAAKVLDLGSPVTADPYVSPDGLVIMYAAAPDSSSPSKLTYATRATPTGPFGNPQQVPGIGTATSNDADPAASRDGCELFYSSTPSGLRDMFVATVP